MRIVASATPPALEWPPARAPVDLGTLREAFLFPAGSDAMAAKLDDPEILLVTTGQQPGLFTGPLYTIHKAFSAAALAALLEDRWQRPVQAVFWVAGDDHDFAEANHAAWPAADGSISRVTLHDRASDAPLTPLYRERLGPDIVPALNRLEQEISGSEFKSEVMAWMARHYHPDATVAASFAGALADLLAPYGVLCLDSTHRAVKRASARPIIKALGLSRDLDRDLADRSRQLSGAGRDPGVPVGDGATLVMLESTLGRDRLVQEGDSYVTRRSGERFTLGDLQGIAAQEPERFSGNVLLRPVLESVLLPTVAYMAGPGELRYLALTAPIYQRMRVHPQQPIPRWSGTLVEPRVDRTLAKYEADLAELLAPHKALEQRVVRSQIPPDLDQAFAELRAQVVDLYQRIATGAAEIDPTLAKPVQNVRQHALSESQDLEKRIVAHLKKRQETELAQIERARSAVLPDGKLQERVFGVVPYLARYGPAVLDELRGAVAAWYAEALEAQPQPS